MSQLVSRLILTMLMFPLAGVVYLLVFVTVYEHTTYWYTSWPYVAAGALTWIFIALWWINVWRGVVVWTRWRETATAVSAAAALIVAGLMGTLIGDDLGMFVGSVAAPLAWVMASVFVWRETLQERAQRLRGEGRATIACPNCGHDLSGQSEARCPGCGSAFTLDELLARRDEARRAQRGAVRGDGEGVAQSRDGPGAEASGES